MTAQETDAIAEILTDIRVDFEALCIALFEKNIPRETVKALRDEVPREPILKEIRAKLSAAAS